MLCVVSAMFPEVSGLIGGIGATSLGEGVWLSDRYDTIVAPVGIGYLEAAIRLQTLLSRYPTIDKVLFCGSAGVYPGKTIEVGDIRLCRDTLLCDGAAEMGLSLYASVMKRGPVESTLGVMCEITACRIVTVLSLTLSDTAAKTIGEKTRGQLENMELYGIASVCEMKAIPWNALIGVTNMVGSAGHLEWKKNYKSVATKTCDFLIGFLNEEADSVWVRQELSTRGN